MSVSFACECGRRFTARNDLRGKHVQCPTCSSLVAVPGRHALLNLISFRGKPSKKQQVAAATLARLEKSSELFQTGTVSTRPVPRAQTPESSGPRAGELNAREVGDTASEATTSTLRSPTIRLRRRPRWTKLLADEGIQPQWYHSIAYPLVAAPTFLWMSLILSFLTSVGVTAWVSIDPFANNSIAYQIFGFSLFFLSYVLATTLTYFNSVLALAARGKVKVEPEIDAAAQRAGASCGVWIGCLLSGPILVFGGAVIYWMHCGELDIVDWIILAEITFFGVAWWLFALLHTNAGETYRIPFPNEVLRLALSLRKAAIELVLPATIVFAGHVLLAFYALGRLQDQPFFAAALLSLFWGSGLFCTSFTLRSLGLAYNRMQREARSASRK